MNTLLILSLISSVAASGKLWLKLQGSGNMTVEIEFPKTVNTIMVPLATTKPREIAVPMEYMKFTHFMVTIRTQVGIVVLKKLQYINVSDDYIEESDSINILGSSLSIISKFVCDKNFYGSSCSVECQNDKLIKNHKMCDQEGNIVCAKGYTGSNCGLEIHSNTCGCLNNGSCVSMTYFKQSASKFCQCTDGFSGDKCQTARIAVTPATPINKVDIIVYFGAFVIIVLLAFIAFKPRTNNKIAQQKDNKIAKIEMNVKYSEMTKFNKNTDNEDEEEERYVAGPVSTITTDECEYSSIRELDQPILASLINECPTLPPTLPPRRQD